VIADRNPGGSRTRWAWGAAFGLVALYVAVRMGAFTLSAEVVGSEGTARLPNTFASVDHPFHVARAEIVWRELTSGNVVRWIVQHQGGYPVEFYPLGEAWLEVLVRTLSLGTLPAEGSHTLAIIGLFLAPGAAFAALAREDGWSPAVGLIAFVLHISLPGSWYDGGYTELVQWGLVTNVSGAVAALCMLPAIVRFLHTGAAWSGAAAAALAAFAIYCNPRSLLALAALGLGAWLAGIIRISGISPRGWASAADIGRLTGRLALVAVLAALLAAPELMALARFRDLYTFVRYSGYTGLTAYAVTAANGMTWPVLVLGLMGLLIGLLFRRRPATTFTAAALILYVALTAMFVVFPAAANLAPQLEPTRLMPLQRFLTIYLAAVAFWFSLSWVVSRVAPQMRWLAPVLATGVAVVILFTQTRPLGGLPPDPASPAVPPVSLYAVAMSARPEQADLQAAIRAADEAAPSGTALLVIGSALSWHQQLWAPLWTERPLFYDNWLWYWHPDHAGTPGYDALAGHHYPDPERTLERDYLSHHGIGGVVVTGGTQEVAGMSPLLRPLKEGIYDVYTVIDPVTTVTFGDQNAESLAFGNQRFEAEAVSNSSGAPVVARVNWHPRWEATLDEEQVETNRLNDGYVAIAPDEPASRAELVYSLQPLDWVARVLSLIGVVGLFWLLVQKSGQVPGIGESMLNRPKGESRVSRERYRRVMTETAGSAGTEHCGQ
jgi:hypothetical protein